MKVYPTVLLMCLANPWSLQAATYYVRTGGNDSHACSSTDDDAHARRNPSAGIACLSAGDTLIIHAGTYTSATGFNTVPGGTSWNSVTTVKGAPGETVILKPAVNGNAVEIDGPTCHYIVVSGLIIDGSDATLSTMRLGNSFPCDHIRIVNNEIRFGKANGILFGGSNHEIINNDIHDCCSVDFNPPGHAIYNSGSNNLFDGNFFHDNGKVVGKSSGGLIQYDGNAKAGQSIDNNIWRNNRITNAGEACMVLANGGTGHLVYNNVIYDCPGGGIALLPGWTGGIYNNTIYNSGNGSGNSPAAINCWSATITLRNNITYLSKPLYDDGTCTVKQDHNVTTNPNFVNDPSDFHITSGSAAINAGMNLTPIFTTDKDGVSRPSSAAWDAGAFQQKSSAISLLPPQNLRVVP